MTFDGYLSFGGNEVVNSERARAYSRGAGCPMGWLKDEACQGLAFAVGSSAYSYQDIVNAPWYDSTIDKISRRFYGVYGLEISGVEDSTRSAEVTEGIRDGGQLGRARRASRDVKVQALLLGRGQDAVEYGMSWLNSVLDPDACGQISADCGTATMSVFSTCPPVRSSIHTSPVYLSEKMHPFEETVYPGVTATIVDDAGIPPWVGTGTATAHLWSTPGSFSYYAGTPIDVGSLIGCSLRSTGGNNPQTLFASATINKSEFIIVITSWGATDVTVYVDRKPVSTNPLISAIGYQYVWVRGLGAGPHVIDMVIGSASNFLQMIVPDGDGTITAGPEPTFRFGVVADSYGDQGIPPYWGGLVRELHRLTGWAIIPLAQGSTGYTNDGASSGDPSKSVFGSTSRRAALAAGNVDAALVLGSVNDAGAAPAVVAAAASTYYSTVSPLPLYVAGVEPLNIPTDPGTTWDTLNAAILGAAQSAPNVRGIIDWRGEHWLTGTGSVSSPRGDGNQDIYIGDAAGTDTIHPNYSGQRYLAGRFVAALAPMPYILEGYIPQTDQEYSASIDFARRYMRRAGAISGPLKLEELRSGDFWAYRVQFVLNGGPSILGVTKVLQLGPTTPTVVQDVPYNLIPYPSAELAGAQNVIVAKNLAANPSAEVNATGWVQDFTVVSGTSPSAFLTNGSSTDIGAGGSTSSFRVRLLGNNGTTAVSAAVSEIVGYQEATIAAGTNRRISLNMWAACLILAGSSPGTLINSMRVTYEFFNGATSLGAQTTFGTFTAGQFGGKASSQAGIAVPATATKVRVRAIANVTWTSTATAGQNSDIRLYADTLTVSIP